jgi:hypothetical protein
MRRLRVKLAIGVAAIGVVVTAAAALAGDHARLKTTLTGYEEVPAISTAGNGTFRASLSRSADEIRYELRYADLEGGAVQQAHIHFGQMSVNGGISVFLCTNLGNGPAGTQACPPPPASISGTITPADVIGPGTPPTNQGIAAGEFDELVSALRRGLAYANVHTATWPAGEIRGQIDGDDDDR